MLKRLLIIVSIVLGGLSSAALPVSTANAQETSDTHCETVGETEIAVCDEFLTFWETNGAQELFGEPLTQAFYESVPVDEQPREVQYFENARLELHPDLEGTPYEVQLGRLGAELLAAEGIEWSNLPGADPDDPGYMERTGQAIAPEFQEYWSNQGIDTGEDGDEFRNSLALFGYPLTPAEEIDTEDGPVLVQWFERTRLEIDSEGTITAVSVGTLLDDSSDGLSLRVQNEIDVLLEMVFNAHEAPGLGVWLESTEIGEWEWSLGYADFEDEIPYSLDTHQRIGSITKAIVASVVLQLVDEGLLALDDTVEEWFPELDGAENVTIQMLGTMTSGVFNYTEALPWFTAIQQDRSRVWEPAELLEFAFNLTGTAEPDGSWAYSNTNYVMLGLIIEEVTGNDLRDELEARVFEPLGMDNTSFPAADDPSLPEPFARGISAMGIAATPEEATDWSISWAHAAGQITSTPADMLAWVPELYHGELISDEMQDARVDLVDVQQQDVLDTAPVETDEDESVESGYGFGLLYGDGWYAHDGLVFGYATMAAYRPDLDTALVVFSNSDIYSDDLTVSAGMAFYLVQQVLEREYPQETP